METLSERLITEMLYTNPLSLLAIKDMQVIQELNELVPYSTAFEIECDYSEEYNVDNFKLIPDIMAVDNDSGEQRYRVPNGLRGIICVYNICRQLKTNSLLNPLSGIHYHVDCTDCYNEIGTLIRNGKNVEYILSELDTWLIGETTEKGTEVFTTNEGSRYYGSWFQLNNLQTIEFRLGEMTFDYKVILKRIIHCNAIVRKFKSQIPSSKQPIFSPVDIPKILIYSKVISLEGKSTTLKKLTHVLQDLIKPDPADIVVPEIPDDLEAMRQLIHNRSHNV